MRFNSLTIFAAVSVALAVIIKLSSMAFIMACAVR